MTMLQYSEKDMQEMRDIGYKSGVNDTVLGLVFVLIGIVVIFFYSFI